MRAVLGKNFFMKKLAVFGCFLLLLATNGLYAQSVSIDTDIKNSADSFVLSEYIIDDNKLTAFSGDGIPELFEWSYGFWTGVNLNYQNQRSGTGFGLKDSMQKALALYEDTNQKFLSYKKKTLLGNIFLFSGLAAIVASPVILIYGNFSSAAINTVWGLYVGGTVSVLTGGVILSLGQENLFDAVNLYNRYQLTGYRNNAPAQR